jgi:hypothetical protein
MTDHSPFALVIVVFGDVDGDTMMVLEVVTLMILLSYLSEMHVFLFCLHIHNLQQTGENTIIFNI